MNKKDRCTFKLLCIAQQELVGVLHLQVKLYSLQQDTLQHHHLLLLGKAMFLEQIVTDFIRKAVCQNSEVVKKRPSVM